MSGHNDKLSIIEKVISYNFYNKLLLLQALTHPSSTWSPKDKFNNYERLEFLGDSILNFVVSEMLFNHYQIDEEGDLAKKKSNLVSGDILSEISKIINLGDYLILSEGEEKNSGRENKRILENALEALIAAIYLDGGIDNAKEFIKRFWSQKLLSMKEPPKNPKVFIQEYSQKKFGILPIYNLVKREGPDHKPLYYVELILKGMAPITCTGYNLKEAEVEAAEKAMEFIINDQENNGK